MNDNEHPFDLNRRHFIKNTSFAALMTMLGGVEIRAQTTAPASGLTEIPAAPAVNFGVIGLNEWGREILQTLALLPTAELQELRDCKLVAICDNYEHAVIRASKEAPGAATYANYNDLLADPKVDAVIIATPTGTHREIALAAIKAGKHVYCEAPLANTIEDARAIAAAARDASKLVFQPGLQERSHPQRGFLLPFIDSGTLGTNIMARAQWHQKGSWARVSPNPQREQELNWRLHQQSSTGLLGEIGIHEIDLIAWLYKQRPQAVTGFGSILFWKDGRDVNDTVQSVFQFPGGVNFLYDLTLCNSFDKQYEVYYGSDGAIMVRDGKAWMFKEVDAALLGWEVYARKDAFYTESGIALVADATKQKTIGGSAVSLNGYPYSSLYYALKNFALRVGIVRGEVKAYVDTYGDDLSGLSDQLKTLRLPPAATWQDGFEATVMAIKANEASVKQDKIIYQDDWFKV